MALSLQSVPAEGRFSSREKLDYGTLAAVSTVNRKRMQIYYSGRVQGVGFRFTVKSVANGFEATGAIRNLPDGRVELVAEGARDELDAFRQAIRESGLERFIEKEDVNWAESKNEFRGFEIVS
jgi:acylphosphatase